MNSCSPARSIGHGAASLRRIVVLNPKGGSGKTTLATNLAAYYAMRGLPTALMDYDPQASSTRWIRKRTENLPEIREVVAFGVPANVTRAFALRVPPGTERVIVDTPAALPASEMAGIVRDAERILIPVLPSDIDIHCAARCISDLLLKARVPRHGNRIGIVANRARRGTLAFQSLRRFLDTLDLPAVAVLRDSQNYIRAAETGIGIHETRPRLVRDDIVSWATLIDWLEHATVPAAADVWPEATA